MIGQPERPIWDAKEDALDRGRFVERLVNALIDQNGKSTGVVVGITGEWGSGKSSVLNLLDDKIREQHRNALVVRFDPWLVAGRDDLIAQFFQEIMATIASNADLKAEIAGEAVSQIGLYAQIIAPLATVLNPLAGAAMAAGGSAAHKTRGSERMSVIRRRVEDKLNRIGAPIVVLVDEVDRIEDSEIRAIAQFVRSVADFKGISYVLAYDSDRVIEALSNGASTDRGRQYLEKIVQLPIALPILFVEERQRLLSSELGALKDSLLPSGFESVERYEDLTERLVGATVSTPRDIKRLVGMYHVARGMIRDEVDWIDLLGFVALAAKFPKTLELIRDNPERYVDNPLLSSEIERRLGQRDAQGDARYVGMLDPGEDSGELRWLLDYLFPAIGTSRKDDVEIVDPVSTRRSLLTVLRLGLIPGAASRQTVRDLLASEKVGVVSIISSARQRDELGSLVDRLDDVYGEELEKGALASLWSGVAEFLKRPTDAKPDDIDAMRNLASNLADIPERAIKRRPKLAYMARGTFQQLVELNDVAIVPSWLRTHMFAHGLYGLDGRGGPVWFGRDETAAWVEKLCSDWRDRFLNGNLRSECWDLHFAYAILQSNKWDGFCRDKLTALLRDNDVFDSVVVMMFGGIHASGRSSIEKLCDFEVYSKRLEQRSLSQDIQTKTAVRQAIAKARSDRFA